MKYLNYSPLVFIIGSAFAASAALVCIVAQDSKNTIIKLKDSALKIEKTAQIEFAKQNPAQFCQRNINLRFLNVNPKDAASVNFECTEMTETELEKHINRTLTKDLQRRAFQDNPYQPWFYSLIQTDLAQNFSMGQPDKFDHKVSYSSFEDLVALSAKNRSDQISIREKYFSQSPEQVFQRLSGEEFINKSQKRNSLSDNILTRRILCSDLFPKDTSKCASALGRISELAEPVFFQNKAYTPVGVWTKMISSEKKYSEGLRIAALKLTQKLKEKDAGDGNILDDLKESFRKSGFTEKEAVDASFDVLALYGNGGANLGDRAELLTKAGARSTCGPSAPNFCGYIDLIGKAIPILDYTSSKVGKPLYSWPKGVSGACNTNKSYHFWMAAYLSRELVKEGYPADIASAASYAAGVGYQINREQGVMTGQIGANALKKSTYDPVINVIRSDLAYAFSGAQFGLSSMGISTGPISIDKTLVKFLERSPEVASDYSATDIGAIDQFRKYKRFKEVIVPTAPME